jgi:hypothetical protein
VLRAAHTAPSLAIAELKRSAKNKKNTNMWRSIIITLALCLTSCTSQNSSNHYYPVQLLAEDSTLVSKCEVLGPIFTDTRGGPFNFDEVAEAEFKRIAFEKYKADAAVITTRRALPLGRIILEGTALRFSKKD